MRKSIAMLLAAVALSMASSQVFADGDGAGKTMYTHVNIWYEKPMKIISTNYHVGAMIEVGTKVTIEEADKKKVVFTDENGTKFRIVCKLKHNNVPCDQLLDNMWFGAKNPKAKGGSYHKLSKSERENVDAGVVERGMSREAVLMAYGYPPTIRTPSIKGNAWTYWKNRWVTRIFRFKGNKVIEVQG